MLHLLFEINTHLMVSLFPISGRVLYFSIIYTWEGVIRIRISKKNRQHNGQNKKVQRDNQRSTKHTHKTKDQVTRTPLKTGGELMCPVNVRSSCFTSGIRRVNLDTNPVISHEWGNDLEVFTKSGTYPWSFVTHIFHNGQRSQSGERKTFEVMTST